MELRRLAERLGLDDVELKEVVRLFVESSTADIESFASAVRTGDSARAAAAIHSIKGAALCLGLNDISGCPGGRTPQPSGLPRRIGRGGRRDQEEYRKNIRVHRRKMMERSSGHA